MLLLPLLLIKSFKTLVSLTTTTWNGFLTSKSNLLVVNVWQSIVKFTIFSSLVEIKLTFIFWGYFNKELWITDKQNRTTEPKNKITSKARIIKQWTMLIFSCTAWTLLDIALYRYYPMKITLWLCILLHCVLWHFVLPHLYYTMVLKVQKI